MARRAVFSFARRVVIVYLLIVLLMTFIERWMVYPAPDVARSDWSVGDETFENVEFTSEDGTRLHGWYLEHASPKRVLLYFHGNGEQVGDNAELMELLAQELDASIFLFDYRGYGRSEGKPFEQGIIQDGLAAQRWLAERTSRDPNQITLMGRSIGGGVAVACAAELGAEALVLVNNFSRLTDAAAYHFPWLPVRLVMRNRYDSIKRIQAYDGPLFMSHGTADGVVPIELGRELFDASPSERKQFYEIPRRGHNDPEPPGFYEALATFLAES